MVQLRGITWWSLRWPFMLFNSGWMASGTQAGIKDGFYGIQGALAENRFALSQCCCETNRLCAVRYEGSEHLRYHQCYSMQKGEGNSRINSTLM